MGRDALAAVPQDRRPVFLGDARRTKPLPDRVTQVVDMEVAQVGVLLGGSVRAFCQAVLFMVSTAWPR